MPVSVSKGYEAWHRGDESETSTTFMARANANPAKNPKLFIAYGFEYQLPGGNGGTGDPGPNSIFYRSLDHALEEQGVTPRQVASFGLKAQPNLVRRAGRRTSSPNGQRKLDMPFVFLDSFPGPRGRWPAAN